jgi:replicative DNA helicase
MINNAINQIQELLSNPLIEDTEKYDLLKDFILEQNFVENQKLKLSENIDDLYNQYVEKYNTPNIVNDTIIKTGFENLDNNFSGFNLGDVVVIAGRPGMGKTQFMVNLVTNFSQKYPVQYFTYDQPKSSLVNRFISCISSIPSKHLVNNRLSNLEYDKLITSKSKIQDLNVFINDDLQNSLTSFINLCIDAITNKGVKIIVVDYLQLLSTHRFKNNREQQFALIMRELKNLARVYNVCIFALSQLSRAVETRGGDKRPQLSDLRESGAIEQDAHKVIFLYRPAYYNITTNMYGDSILNLMEVIFAKNNIDKTFSANLWVNEEFTTFTDSNLNEIDFEFPLERMSEIKKYQYSNE